MGIIKENVSKDIKAQKAAQIENMSKIDQAFAKYNIEVD